MTQKAYQTLLAGFGQIAAGYAEDPRYVAHVSCPTHAHALCRHIGFDWRAVVDTSEQALESARVRWGVSEVALTVDELNCADEIEVAVLATPPNVRLEIIQGLPNLKAVMVEKPLASDLASAELFLRTCQDRKIQVQTNITRRGDSILRSLIAGKAELEIGPPRAIFGLYGNGLSNMATHGIDLIRMLFGEIQSVQALTSGTVFSGSPIPDDLNLPFVMTLDSGVQAAFMPIRFEEYREAGIDVWGAKGRLQLLQEGLVLLRSKTAPCRSFSGVNEIPSDSPECLNTGYGDALYAMYENLYSVLEGVGELYCSGNEALATMRVVDAILASYRMGGGLINMETFGHFPRTIYFAHDPGAAELLAFLFTKEKSKDAVLIGQGYAPLIFRKLGLKFQEVPDTESMLNWMEMNSRSVDRIVSGTSQSVDADCRLWKWAAERGIHVEAHVDHWMHPVERFTHLGQVCAPQNIHVVDDASKSALIAAGIPEETIHIVGQPVVEEKAQLIQSMRLDSSVREKVTKLLRIAHGEAFHVFISENLTELGLKSTYGFDEKDAFLAFRAELRNSLIVVKAHPKESEDKWFAFIDREGIKNCRVITGQISPEELMAAADSVGGIFSILLVEARLAGIPVVSCQPRMKVENPMDNAYVGGIKTINKMPT